MKLKDHQRAEIEDALDSMALELKGLFVGRAVWRKYEKAISHVRDTLAGFRRLRGDHNTKRPTPQQELPSL